MYLRFRQNLHDNGSISGFIALNKKIVGKKKNRKSFIWFFTRNCCYDLKANEVEWFFIYPVFCVPFSLLFLESGIISFFFQYTIYTWLNRFNLQAACYHRFAGCFTSGYSCSVGHLSKAEIKSYLRCNLLAIWRGTQATTMVFDFQIWMH